MIASFSLPWNSKSHMKVEQINSCISCWLYQGRWWWQQWPLLAQPQQQQSPCPRCSKTANTPTIELHCNKMTISIHELVVNVNDKKTHLTNWMCFDLLIRSYIASMHRLCDADTTHRVRSQTDATSTAKLACINPRPNIVKSARFNAVGPVFRFFTCVLTDLGNGWLYV